MNHSIATIIENKKIADSLFEMKLDMGENTEGIRPGQFINIKLAGKYLRRPISICDWNENTITIIYKVVGSGTKQMSEEKTGETLDLLWPLGNGFTLQENGAQHTPILIGGGAGVPPMFGLCRKLIEAGQKPIVILGFRSEEDAYYKEQFEALGTNPIITTEDGSMGIKGFVTDALRQCEAQQARIFACGPEAMLKAIDQTAPEDVPGQFSFEERMGCGFGACMGCSCQTKYGAKRICKDGPVLERSEVIW